MTILPGVTGLLQHLKNLINNLNMYRPEFCPHCGMAGLWRWGYYYRKPDRNSDSEDSLNPIPIPRFLCPNCKKTMSVLPECIAPRRWYIWKKQQEAILLFLSGMKIRSIAKKVMSSRSTISRWIAWMQGRFRNHKDAICNHFPNLGLANNENEFWKACFKNILLSKAMYLCHASGVNVP
jgi:transposase-like protein